MAQSFLKKSRQAPAGKPQIKKKAKIGLVAAPKGAKAIKAKLLKKGLSAEVNNKIEAVMVKRANSCGKLTLMKDVE
jgi:hypothetical protein